ncbi:MAG: hypothetical protein DHS20C17_13640 [Cyclobacteriaceae bacterium]|nr:MAG: hypothetical protein DHS20C17_13640 [Cyclobacteriaceae bacterium]
MWRILLLGLLGLIGLSSYGQIKKHYTVENNNSFDRVAVTLSGGSGTCYIRPTPNNNPVNIYGTAESDVPGPSCESILEQRTQKVNVNFLDGKLNESSTKKVSFNVFGDTESNRQNQWHVYLSKKKPVQLNLNYGMGNAFVDLSGLAVEKLNITTGSADVNIGYISGQYNQQEMDTFCIKVDLGTLEARQVALSNAKTIIADVGFGSLHLDFTNKSLVSSNVNATVGAGNLVVNANESINPMIIYIQNSPLCRVKIPQSFTEIRENVFVSSQYDQDAENLITFNIDVTMGNIIFKTF